MRILIYWEQDSWGGVDTHLLELLSTWPAPDDEIVLMVNEGNAGFIRLQASFVALPNVRCASVPSRSHNELTRCWQQRPLLRHFSRLLHFIQPLTYWLYVRQLQAYFEKLGKFDILLGNNGGYPAAWGTLCALEAGAKAGIDTRILLVHHAATSPGPFMWWYEQLMDRRVSRTATAMICVSWATRAALLARRWLDDHIVRIRVIHHGISIGSTLSAGEAPDLRLAAGAAREDLLVGIVGRVEPYKGQDDLIFALAQMDPIHRARIRLLVIGAGEAVELKRLKRVATNLGVQDRVHFLGYMPGRPVDLIAQMDVLAMVTRNFEGFGLTLAEAMAVGTPVLATRVGAIPEFVDESTGVLINPGAPPEIAAALTDFVARPDEWSRRAAVARHRSETRIVSMAADYRRLFVECLAESQDNSRAV
jgi:glycosyltransferase involved in cell wall biosynthesis